MRERYMPRRLILGVMGIGLAYAVTSAAWAAGDAANGKSLAQQECSNCHIVDKNKPSELETQPAGPDFMLIKGLTPAKLKARLNAPHPVMSKFPQLTNPQIDDLVAYIVAMKS